MQIEFDNSALRELPGDSERGPRVREVLGAAWSAVEPTPVAAPRLLAWSPDAASLIAYVEGSQEDGYDVTWVHGGRGTLWVATMDDLLSAAVDRRAAPAPRRVKPKPIAARPPLAAF